MSIEQETNGLSNFIEGLFRKRGLHDADTIILARTGGNAAVSILKNKEEINKQSTSTKNFEEFSNWAYQRYSVFRPQGPRPEPSNMTWNFISTALIGGNFISFAVKRSQRLSGDIQLVLSQFVEQSVDGIMEFLALRGKQKEEFEKVSTIGSGCYVVGTPQKANSHSVLSLFLSVCGTRNVKVFQEDSAQKIIPQDELSIILVEGDDACDSLLKAKHCGFDFNDAEILGSFCLGFINRTCQACLKESALDPALLDFLPSQLREELHGKYKIGRGCNECNHSGCYGKICVCSIAPGSLSLSKALASGVDYSKLIELTYNQGARSLLEDGVQKVADGLSSLAALYECTKVFPAVYLKYLQPAKTSHVDPVRPVAVPGDFYSSASAENAKGLVIGSSAFSNNPLEQPVIAKKPKREKPLLMIVEDDSDQRDILELLFKSAGYDVAMALDGDDALKRIDSINPDLMISDLMMPKIDGNQLIRSLKASEKYHRLPVLILTVVSDSQKEYELLDIGADDYCEKTIQRKILLKRVEKLLQRG